MIPSRGVMKNREEAKTISVRISDIPSYQVAYIRRIGPYQPERMTSVFSRLLQWAASRGLWDGNSILIGTVWNNPRITPEDKCICDACITVPESLRFTEGVNIQSLPGGKFAVYRCEIGPRDFPEAWRRLISHWLLSSDYQPDDRPSYVLYHDGWASSSETVESGSLLGHKTPGVILNQSSPASSLWDEESKKQ